MKELLKKIMATSTRLPKQMYSHLNLKYESRKYEKAAQFKWDELLIPPNTIQAIKYKLQQDVKTTPALLLNVEKEILNKIQKETIYNNKNNVTRTEAYYNYYKNNPEIHWALLAHLVSRNGGWNMTDLKGPLLSNLMSESQAYNFFMFLERANYLIFQDAYPQLLLYEAAKKTNKNLFHLLPFLGISKFMRPFWDSFYKEQNSQLITIALIVNEQHYIESPIIQNDKYKKKVLDSLLFQTQELFQLTYVLFPFHKNDKVRLSGAVMENFSSLFHRIDFGKRLYATLFGIEPLHQDIMRFVKRVSHTGSRADYWPNLFTAKTTNETNPTEIGCPSENASIYSPKLELSWPNIKHTVHHPVDWYKDNKILKYFEPFNIPKHFEITPNYCSDLNKIITLQHILDN